MHARCKLYTMLLTSRNTALNNSNKALHPKCNMSCKHGMLQNLILMHCGIDVAVLTILAEGHQAFAALGDAHDTI